MAFMSEYTRWSPTTEDLAELEERFGPPVVVAVEPNDIWRARAGVWLAPILVTVGVVAIFVTPWIIIKRRLAGHAADPR